MSVFAPARDTRLIALNEPSANSTVTAGSNLDVTVDVSACTQLYVLVVPTASHAWTLKQFFLDSSGANISSTLADTILASGTRGATKLDDTLLVLSPRTIIRYTNDSVSSQDVKVYVYGIRT